MLILALAQVVALQGGTVHSMVPGDEPQVATVLVEEGRFLAVGPDLEIPEGAVVVDVSGKHLVPGLIDGMVHHDMEHDPLYILGGVTLARDMGNDLGRILVAATPAARDQMPGPELWISGAIFDGVPPATTEAVIARDAAEVSDKLPRLLEEGIDFVSFHQGLPLEAWRQLISTSHDLGLRCWGPIPRGASLAEIAASGQDGLVYLEGFSSGETWDAEEAHARVLELAKGGIAVMPLLHVYGYRTQDQSEHTAIFDYLAPYYSDWWRGDLEQRKRLFDDQYLESGRSQYANLESVVHDLWKAGVALIPGSAAPNPWMEPGGGLHDELAAWSAAGIPNGEILRMATFGAASILGISEERGSIQDGALADLLVLSGDPREDIAILREPEGVLVRGAYMNAEALAGLRQALFDAQEEVSRLAALPIVVEKPELPEGRVVLEGRVESRAFDRVLAAEEYWVVRCFTGETAWCARMVTRPGVGNPEIVHTLVQRFRDEKLEAFDLLVDGESMRYQVEGMHVSGQFRIKRKINDQYLDTNSTPTRPGLVDAGLSSAAMLLAHYYEDGPQTVIYFEGMDPMVASWETQRGSEGVLAMKTASGPMVATFHPNGALERLARTVGQATMHYEGVRQTSSGGPGMPPKPFPRATPEGESPEDQEPVDEAPADGQDE